MQTKAQLNLADDMKMCSAAYADTECSSQQDCCVERQHFEKLWHTVLLPRNR